MSVKFYVGLASFLISLSSIILNLLIFFPTFRLAFIAKRSSVYIIAFFNIISDLTQLSIICFYLSISIMEDSYIFVGDRESTLGVILGTIWLTAWYFDGLIQPIMAVNRLCIITLKNYDIFTFKSTISIFIALIAITTSLSVSGQYFYPCCTFVFDHKLVSFLFVPHDGLFDYTYKQCLVINCISIIPSTICYGSVFISIRNAQKDATKLKGGSHSKQNNKDVKYLMQFFFISVFYLLVVISFEVLPRVVPAGVVEWFWSVALLMILNATSNSVIFLLCNKEIQNALRFPWKKNLRSGSIFSTTNATRASILSVRHSIQA